MARAPVGLGLLLALAMGGTAAGQPSYFDAVGYTALQQRLGAATPTGAGVVVSQIEAVEGSAGYRPDTNPMTFPGKTFNDMSGGGAVSGHATGVGQYFYGNQSIAPGITQINTYRIDGTLGAGDWLGPAYLRAGTASAPLTDTGRVQNHSYVANVQDANDPGLFEYLRRLDFAVRRDNVVAVVAVNNGPGPIPGLQANGYNTIAVGLSNGQSSSGPTTGDVIGRSKPDIVVPLGETSYATPVVAAAAALLVQTAGTNAAAGRVETIKAALLSGATIAPFAGLAQPWTRTNNGSYVEPLDRRFGAGQLNVDASHRILSAPRQNGTALALGDRAGWDFGTLTAVGEKRRYYFEVPADAPGAPTSASVSATVTWLRRFPQASAASFSTQNATLSDIELRLFNVDAAFALGTLVDQSVSPIDNVQHLNAALTPGRRYALELTLADLPSGQFDEDYGFAFLTSLTPVPEPAGLLAVAVAVGAWHRRHRWMKGIDRTILAVVAVVVFGTWNGFARADDPPAAPPPVGRTQPLYDMTNRTPYVPPLVSTPTTAVPTRTFQTGEMVTVGGPQSKNFYPDLLMDVYVVPHRTWLEDDSLVAGAVHRSLVRSDAAGALPRTQLWLADRAGVFDLIVDYDNDGLFSWTLDAVTAFEVLGPPAEVQPVAMLPTRPHAIPPGPCPLPAGGCVTGMRLPWSGPVPTIGCGRPCRPYRCRGMAS